MTCIVGVVDQGRVFIGGDSGAFSGWSANIRVDAKVFEAGGFVYGVCGSPRINQILRYVFQPPPFLGGDPMAYMVCQFIPELRAVMGREVNDAARTEIPGNSSFLVGFAGRLFEVWPDWQVAETAEGVSALGCAREPALGALYAARWMLPRVALEVALDAAVALNAGVRKPFLIIEATE